MSEPFVGEIIMFGGNFAPRGYADCDGQILAVNQNDALFSLLGTIYGGDGRTTFGLPDLRGRVALHQGTGPGLSQRRLGSQGGAEEVTLNSNQLPPHGHQPQASQDPATANTPTSSLTLAKTSTALYGTDTPATPLASNAVGNSGGNRSHHNMMPFQTIRYCIALVGIYPSRS